MSDEPNHRSVDMGQLVDAIAMQKGTRTAKPWWVDFVSKVGIWSVVAFFLIRFITGEMTQIQKTTLANTEANRTMMTQASIDMGAFVDRDDQWKDTMLLVARQTCRNSVPTGSPTARTDRDACDIIRPQK